MDRSASVEEEGEGEEESSDGDGREREDRGREEAVMEGEVDMLEDGEEAGETSGMEWVRSEQGSAFVHRMRVTRYLNVTSRWFTMMQEEMLRERMLLEGCASRVQQVWRRRRRRREHSRMFWLVHDDGGKKLCDLMVDQILEQVTDEVSLLMHHAGRSGRTCSIIAQSRHDTTGCRELSGRVSVSSSSLGGGLRGRGRSLQLL